ncbi:MAG TPA: hypothetical protein VNU01_11730 [Egibacteraceae bacterium]|nr:hypothetical protein [Egibacteraceae bacterium]
MSEHEQPDASRDADLDPAADTTMFQAFVQRAEQGQQDPRTGKPVGAPFRLATLLVGLGVFAGLVWLLLRI